MGVMSRAEGVACSVQSVLRITACSVYIMSWCSFEAEWPSRKSAWDGFTLFAVILFTASQSIIFCFAIYSTFEEMKIFFKVSKFLKFVFNNFPLNFQGNLWQCRPQTYIHM